MCAMQSMRRPKLFWVSAGAPLVSVIISTLLVFAFKLQLHGISTVGVSGSLTKFNSFLSPFCWLWIYGVFSLFVFFLWLDWKITRRVKSSFMELAAVPWKPPGIGDQNRAYYWHHLPHCKFLNFSLNSIRVKF